MGNFRTTFFARNGLSPVNTRIKITNKILTLRNNQKTIIFSCTYYLRKDGPFLLKHLVRKCPKYVINNIISDRWCYYY